MTWFAGRLEVCRRGRATRASCAVLAGAPAAWTEVGCGGKCLLHGCRFLEELSPTLGSLGPLDSSYRNFIFDHTCIQPWHTGLASDLVSQTSVVDAFAKARMKLQDWRVQNLKSGVPSWDITPAAEAKGCGAFRVQSLAGWVSRRG